MIRTLLATAALALIASTSDAIAAMPVQDLAGVWTPVFLRAHGGRVDRISAATYAQLQRAGRCASDSSVQVWPRAHQVVFLCEA